MKNVVRLASLILILTAVGMYLDAQQASAVNNITFIPAVPPGGVGGACTATTYGYITPTGQVVTCIGSVWVAAASTASAPPTGPAGGVLSGTYPNPGFAAAPAFTGVGTIDTAWGIGTNPAASGAVRIANLAAINSRNFTNGGDLILMDTTTADILRIGGSGVQAIEATVGKINFGGSTASFPQWNRSGTTLQALLADQSARANVQVAESNYQTLKSSTNCTSSAAPAVCAAAATGSVVVAAAATTVIVNTTAVTANSAILLLFDSSLGTKLSVTCNTTVPTVYSVSARTAATSFTITSTAPTTNPACFSYIISN